jgi:hypothetical protein
VHSIASGAESTGFVTSCLSRQFIGASTSPALFDTARKPIFLIHTINVGFSDSMFSVSTRKKAGGPSRGETSRPTLSHLLWSYL